LEFSEHSFGCLTRNEFFKELFSLKHLHGLVKTELSDTEVVSKFNTPIQNTVKRQVDYLPSEESLSGLFLEEVREVVLVIG